MYNNHLLFLIFMLKTWKVFFFLLIVTIMTYWWNQMSSKLHEIIYLIFCYSCIKFRLNLLIGSRANGRDHSIPPPTTPWTRLSKKLGKDRLKLIHEQTEYDQKKLETYAALIASYSYDIIMTYWWCQKSIKLNEIRLNLLFVFRIIVPNLV